MEAAGSIEQAVARLREAWASGREPDLRTYVSDRLGETDLAELVEADAEERIDRGLPAGLAHYEGVIPGLAGLRRVCRAILVHEFGAAGDQWPAVREALRTKYPALEPEIELVAELCGLVEADVDPWAADRAPEFQPRAGEAVGKYALVELLGRGSFGEVWRAWDRELERYVALKLLTGARDSLGTGGLRSLLGEARAAAALDHENVVRVYAAGQDGPTGCYFIDSQLVADPAPTPADPHAVAVGTSLERLIGRERSPDGSARGLPARPAAELMEQVCRGVAAAHARGITHRDLKPANILVTPSGRAMVADFGLSRFVAARRDAPAGPEATSALATETGRIVGTPSFMAPEQARAEAATPLSDIYALGATLRYCLTGQAAFRPSGRRHSDARWDVILQVREDEPPPLAGVPPTLAAICAKAMARRPEDRYLSAADMGADLRRWLERRPTLAHPLTARGRADLWLRRNAGVAGAAAGAVILVSLATGWYISSVRHERDRAVEAERIAEAGLAESQRQFNRSNAALKFLTDMFASVRAGAVGSAGQTPIGRVVEQAARSLDGAPLPEPEVEASIRQMLGQAFQGLGLFAHAGEQYQRSLDIRRRVLGPGHPESLRALQMLAWLVVEAGEPARGADLMRAAADAAAESLGVDSAEAVIARGNWARVLVDAGRRDEAAVALAGALGDSRRILGAGHASTMSVALAYAGLLNAAGRSAEAEGICRKVRPDAEAMFGSAHPTTQAVVDALIDALLAQGKFAEAVGECLAAAEAKAAHYGPENQATLAAVRRLAGVYRLGGRPSEALAILRELADAQARISGPDHPYTLDTRLELCGALRLAGSPAEAEPIAADVQARIERAGGMPGPAAQAAAERALALIDLARLDDAERVLRRAHERFAAAGPEAAGVLVDALVRLYTAWDRPEEADAWRARLPRPAVPGS